MPPDLDVAVMVALISTSILNCVKKAFAVQNFPAGQASAKVAARVVVEPVISASDCGSVLVMMEVLEVHIA